MAGHDALRFALLNKRRAIEVGRDTACALLLTDASVSRRHARLGFVDGELRVEDLGSRNGTRVNGKDVPEGALRPGDRLELGNVLLRFNRVSPSELAHLRGVLARLGASDRDPLTGLLTRAYLDERLPSLLARSARKGRTASALFVDVDHFKRINDRFGHAVGDDVLRELARLLLYDLREREVCIRYGGDEVLVVLEGADEGHAATITERLRKTVESHDWARLANGLAVRISCGIAQRQPREPVRAWLERADGALYAAKRAGRNRVLRASALPAGKGGSA
ncbi:MAG TPA: GGDEF domain-containing protein [Vicinamibacteria bacterium]|nr:GGDEF domain-containing protein [Vicinamibacteria bacterium]